MTLLDDAGGGLAILGRLGTFGGIALVCGALVVGARALRPRGDRPDETTDAMARTCLHAVLAGGSLVAVAAVIRLFAQAAAFAATGDALGPILLVLLGTTWGVTAVGQVLLGLVLCAAALLARRWTHPAERLGEAQFVYPALGLCVVPAFMGHAAADPFLAVGVTVDVLHVAGASVWSGGVVLLAWLARRAAWRAPVATVIEAFHPDAVAAVTAVVVSGVVAAWRRLPDPWTPLATPYGELLAWKVLLVVPVLALGWWNATRGPARLRAGPGTRPLTALASEGGLFVVVLSLTALLTGTSPDP